MSYMHRFVDDCIGRHTKKVRRLCEPLFSALGIHYLAYMCIDRQGNCMALSSAVEFSHFYVDQALYTVDPIVKIPFHLPNGFIWFKDVPDAALQARLFLPAAEKFDYAHPLAIVEENETHKEVVIIMAPRKNFLILQTYLNQNYLIKQFVHYFKQETKAIMLKNLNKSLDIRPFMQKTNGEELYSLIPQNQHSFETYSPRLNQLTVIQRKCLAGLLQGYTAKHIAARENISPRTAEKRVDQIKFKWGCHGKADILKQLTSAEIAYLLEMKIVM